MARVLPTYVDLIQRYAARWFRLWKTVLLTMATWKRTRFPCVHFRRTPVRAPTNDRCPFARLPIDIRWNRFLALETMYRVPQNMWQIIYTVDSKYQNDERNSCMKMVFHVFFRSYTYNYITFCARNIRCLDNPSTIQSTRRKRQEWM